MAHEVGIINASHLYTEIKLKHRDITQNNKWFDPSVTSDLLLLNITLFSLPF